MRYALPTTLLFVLLLTACGKEEAPAANEPAPSPEPAASAEPAVDPVTGLKMAENWEIVRANCTACHSAKLVTQQRGTAQQWLTMIRWMQAKQNLWQFDPVTEEKIIGYLADNYPPSQSQRRAALSPDLMPPNPYAASGGL
jgi:cytochrome c5